MPRIPRHPGPRYCRPYLLLLEGRRSSGRRAPRGFHCTAGLRAGRHRIQGEVRHRGRVTHRFRLGVAWALQLPGVRAHPQAVLRQPVYAWPHLRARREGACAASRAFRLLHLRPSEIWDPARTGTWSPSRRSAFRRPREGPASRVRSGHGRTAAECRSWEGPEEGASPWTMAIASRPRGAIRPSTGPRTFPAMACKTAPPTSRFPWRGQQGRHYGGGKPFPRGRSASRKTPSTRPACRALSPTGRTSTRPSGSSSPTSRRSGCLRSAARWPLFARQDGEVRSRIMSRLRWETGRAGRRRSSANRSKFSRVFQPLPWRRSSRDLKGQMRSPFARHRPRSTAIRRALSESAGTPTAL